ncbi:Golgi-body localisation protein domain [Striga asiatica]|uniref:Golgi-body localisation protein domain n=1 Tax=Striga asiatica TaxID=4170 RepID=A0A5A7R2X0_STRAF|nr:Golgi-body localisation protein domain [Striga asiatica]
MAPLPFSRVSFPYEIDRENACSDAVWQFHPERNGSKGDRHPDKDPPRLRRTTENSSIRLADHSWTAKPKQQSLSQFNRFSFSKNQSNNLQNEATGFLPYRVLVLHEGDLLFTSDMAITMGSGERLSQSSLLKAFIPKNLLHADKGGRLSPKSREKESIGNIIVLPSSRLSLRVIQRREREKPAAKRRSSFSYGMALLVGCPARSIFSWPYLLSIVEAVYKIHLSFPGTRSQKRSITLSLSWQRQVSLCSPRLGNGEISSFFSLRLSSAPHLIEEISDANAIGLRRRVRVSRSTALETDAANGVVALSRVSDDYDNRIDVIEILGSKRSISGKDPPTVESEEEYQSGLVH